MGRIFGLFCDMNIGFIMINDGWYMVCLCIFLVVCVAYYVAI